MSLLGSLDYATFDFRIAEDGQAYLLDVNADATLHLERSLAGIAGIVANASASAVCEVESVRNWNGIAIVPDEASRIQSLKF